jgi:hypothetical protein
MAIADRVITIPSNARQSVQIAQRFAIRTQLIRLTQEEEDMADLLTLLRFSRVPRGRLGRPHTQSLCQLGIRQALMLDMAARLLDIAA